MRICSVEGCGDEHRARGCCYKHWKRLKKYGDPLAGAAFVERPVRRCSIDGCEDKHYARGFCDLHYDRSRRGTDMMQPKAVYAPAGTRSICEIGDCGRNVVSRGLCAAHSQRRDRGKVIDAPVRPRYKTLEERFQAYTERADSGCLLWIGSMNPNGYGTVTRGPGSDGGSMAHRVAYEAATGEVLLPYEAIHHICAVRNCVEPTHLQKVSTVENGVEMLERNWYIKRIATLEAAMLEIAPEHPLLNS